MRVPKIYRFIIHPDWYIRTDDGLYIPTEMAPEQAVKDMEIVNERKKELMSWLQKHPEAIQSKKGA